MVELRRVDIAVKFVDGFADVEGMILTQTRVLAPQDSHIRRFRPRPEKAVRRALCGSGSNSKMGGAVVLSHCRHFGYPVIVLAACLRAPLVGLNDAEQVDPEVPDSELSSDCYSVSEGLR
jgi:hypothetical protein